MKQKNKFRMFVVSVLVCFCFTAASAQTLINKQSNDPLLNKKPVDKVEYYKQKQIAADKQKLTVVANKAPLTVTKNAATAPETDKTVLGKISMGQLLLQKKQAAEKGLSTAVYDEAIMKKILKMINKGVVK